MPISQETKKKVLEAKKALHNNELADYKHKKDSRYGKYTIPADSDGEQIVNAVNSLVDVLNDIEVKS